VAVGLGGTDSAAEIGQAPDKTPATKSKAIAWFRLRGLNTPECNRNCNLQASGIGLEKLARKEYEPGMRQFSKHTPAPYRLAFWRGTPISKRQAPHPNRRLRVRPSHHASSSWQWLAPTLIASLFLFGSLFSTRAEDLFKATPLTKDGEFTAGIEGPACDRDGNVYAVNFAREHTIGKVSPSGRAELFIELPPGSTGNGIRFDRAGKMFVADYTGHNVLEIDLGTREIRVFAHEGSMHQPNDLTMTADGVLYASDPDWKNGTGQIWRIGRDGKITRVAGDLGTSNGIEVSPDGKTLYVNESVQRNIWAFQIERDGSLTSKRRLKNFPDFGFDGMRCDVAGNLYVTRHGKGTVAKISPKGEVLQEIDVLGPMPTNICFGGPDGRTAYVTEVKHQRLVQFRVDQPGLEWARWQQTQRE